MLFSSTLAVISTSLLVNLCHAVALPQQSYNNGQWAPTSAAATAAVAAVSPVASAAVASAGGWEYSITWPAGCESWANPCPVGAHIAGGGVAGGAKTSAVAVYVNDFTSYTSQTDSRGVITGMPPVATVPAGASSMLAAMATAASSANASKLSTTLSVSRAASGGFSQGTTTSSRPAFTGAANARSAEVVAVVVGAAGFVAALL